ncbi:MAG: hypothetical protein AMXMBFR84_28990 [Candidatus Hydrogenedentota bacterium]
MNCAHRSRLIEVVCEVTEVFAFMFADPMDDEGESAPTPDEGVLAAIDFSGAADGSLTVCLPVALALDMACNAIGSESADPQEILDAVKEYANQLCGQMLTAMAGSEPVFVLGIPTAVFIDSEDWSELRGNPDCIQLIVEDSDPILCRFDCDRMVWEQFA